MAPQLNEVPARLAEIREEFLEIDPSDRLLLLLDYSNALPELPDRLSQHPGLLEQVVECQSPVFLLAEFDENQKVRLFATAPAEAPTTRGFASILVQGLDGLEVGEVLAIPEDFPQSLGLTALVSPLRIRGMTAMLGRTKRQVREQLES